MTLFTIPGTVTEYQETPPLTTIEYPPSLPVRVTRRNNSLILSKQNDIRITVLFMATFIVSWSLSILQQIGHLIFLTFDIPLHIKIFQ